jgi:hypothetical protein
VCLFFFLGMPRRNANRNCKQGNAANPIVVSSSSDEEDRDESPRPPQISPPSPEFGLDDDEELEEPGLPYNMEYKALMDSVHEFCKEAERNPGQGWIWDVLNGLLTQMEEKFPAAAKPPQVDDYDDLDCPNDDPRYDN